MCRGNVIGKALSATQTPLLLHDMLAIRDGARDTLAVRPPAEFALLLRAPLLHAAAAPAALLRPPQQQRQFEEILLF